MVYELNCNKSRIHSEVGITWVLRVFTQTCNHARKVLCMTSWMVNKRPRTASCSSIISLVLFLIPSSKLFVVLPLKCWRSSNTISSLAWSDHFTLMTCIEWWIEFKLLFFYVSFVRQEEEEELMNRCATKNIVQNFKYYHYWLHRKLDSLNWE